MTEAEYRILENQVVIMSEMLSRAPQGADVSQLATNIKATLESLRVANATWAPIWDYDRLRAANGQRLEKVDGK